MSTRRLKKATKARRKKVTAKKAIRHKPHPLNGTNMLVAFEIEQGHVCIIDREGTRIPLFRASQLGSGNPTDALRECIATLMDDMDSA